MGLTLYVRNSRVFARFQHVKRIPKEYYQNEVQLRGIVREITPTGLLKVEHQPIISIRRLLGRKASPKVNHSVITTKCTPEKCFIQSTLISEKFPYFC